MVLPQRGSTFVSGGSTPPLRGGWTNPCVVCNRVKWLVECCIGLRRVRITRGFLGSVKRAVSTLLSNCSFVTRRQNVSVSTLIPRFDQMLRLFLTGVINVGNSYKLSKFQFSLCNLWFQMQNSVFVSTVRRQ